MRFGSTFSRLSFSCLITRWTSSPVPQRDTSTIFESPWQTTPWAQRPLWTISETLPSVSPLPAVDAVDEDWKNGWTASLIVCDRLCSASFCLSAPKDAAAAAGRKEVVTFLLDAGFEIDRPNNLGETALHRAARRSNPLPCSPQSRLLLLFLLCLPPSEQNSHTATGATSTFAPSFWPVAPIPRS